MKKILIFAISLLTFTSCYEDYVKDYDYSTVYVTNPYNARTFVIGEINSIKVGAVLSGVLYNEIDRTVSYQVDNTLVNDAALAKLKQGESYVKKTVSNVKELIPLPSDYYTLSNESQIVIPKDDHLGMVTITIDEDKFAADPLAIDGNYAFAYKITSAPSVDSLNTAMSTSVIALQYEAMLYGNYWHGGKGEVRDANGTVTKSFTYYTQIPQAEVNVWSLSTTSPMSLKTNRIGNASIDGGMILTLKDDGSVDVNSASDDLEVAADGENTYNQAKLLQDRRIYLKYKYDNGDGTTTHCTDTLTFRNRTRDGVNEWMDENPENYQ